MSRHRVAALALAAAVADDGARTARRDSAPSLAGATSCTSTTGTTTSRRRRSSAFEESCKCKVVQNYYSDNEELLAKLAAGANGYDVLVPTGNAVQALIAQGGRCSRSTRRRSPNLKNVEPQFLNTPFDPGNKYSVPYAMSITLIGYNDEKMKELGLPTDTWAVIFDPEVPGEGQGPRHGARQRRASSSPRRSSTSATRPTTTDPKHWDEARDVIMKAKPYWAAFNASSYIKELTVGNIWLVHGYSQRHLPGEPRRAGGRAEVHDPAGRCRRKARCSRSTTW